MPTGSALSRDRLRALRRRSGTISFVTVLVAGLALSASSVQTAVYASSTKVLLEPRAPDSLFDPSGGQRQDPARLVRNEIQVLTSEPVREAVRDDIGVAPPIKVTAAGDTDIITIRAEDGNPEQAARIANAYADAYISFRRRQALDDLEATGKEVQAKVTELQGRLDELDRRVAAAPAATRERVRASLAQQREDLISISSLFRQRLDQIQVESALQSGGARIVTTARAQDDPVRPQPVRAGALGLMAGLGAGLALAFVREHFDDSLGSKEDLEEAARVPVLGMLPRARAPRWKAGRVVSQHDPASPAAEAYRTLRTSVQFLSLDRDARILLVTSPGAGEGKTTVAANLGVVLAQAGVPAVVVGADLRRPRVHDAFGLPNDVGFTSVLLGEVDLDAALQGVPGIDQLRVLASGPIPPNPSELLASAAAGRVLAALTESGATVVIDSPPVLPVTDALVLAAKADATLLVGMAGKTSRRNIGRAVELLEQVHASQVVAVLNAVPSEGGYGYSYGYYSEARRRARRT